MRSVTKLIRRLVIGLGLAALLIVVFPTHAEPLWSWGKSIGLAVGYDPLPAFAAAKDYAGFSIVLLTLLGVVYNGWRDRRLDVVQAEYEHHTGARGLKQRIADLSRQLETAVHERNQWQKNYDILAREHSAALVACKEHEVHSSYGREDREALRQLRTQFCDLLKERGHTQGFREAMQVVLDHLVGNPEASSELATTVATVTNATPLKNRAIPHRTLNT